MCLKDNLEFVQDLIKVQFFQISGITCRGAFAHWCCPEVEETPQQQKIEELLTNNLQYEVFLNNNKIATTTETSISITDLYPGQNYKVQ